MDHVLVTNTRFNISFQNTRRLPRHRRSLDLDTFDLPFGVHLPPYEENDPYKEYSPPSYQTIVPLPKDDDEITDCLDYVTSEQLNEHLESIRNSERNHTRRVSMEVIWI